MSLPPPSQPPQPWPPQGEQQYGQQPYGQQPPGQPPYGQPLQAPPGQPPYGQPLRAPPDQQPYDQPPPAPPGWGAPAGPGPKRRGRSGLWLGILGVLALLLVGAGILAAVRYVPLVDDIRAVRESAQRFADEARALEPSDLDGETVAGLRADLNDLDTRLAPIRDVVQGDLLVGAASLIPGLEVHLDAAAALVSAADSLVEAGGLGLDMADELVALQEANAADPSFALMPGVVALMAESTDEIDRIGQLVDDATARLAEIPPEALRQVREARDLVADPLDTYAPLLEQYREVDDVLPALLGWGDAKRYLVLAQNPAELRPAGGYAGTVGVLGFRDGALVEQRFQDVYDLDLQRDLPFIEPPAELANHLLGTDQSWRLADAAWSADFPTGARKALEFYELEANDADIDGVIAITTYALDRLLEVVGPVEVEDYGVSVAAGETTMTLLGETRGTETSTEGRKDILGELANAAMQRLLALPPEQWLPMAEALLDIGTQKSALAWFKDSRAQELIVDGGYGGLLRGDPGDYVYALESNMAPTSKYNLVVDREASLVAKVAADGSALDSLRLDWLNRAGDDGEPYTSLREFSNNEEGWYGSYLRLLVPQGSELVTANGEASDQIRGAEVLPDDTGRSVFGNYLFMPPGESTMSYLWTVPDAAVETEAGWEYRLLVQKQPGARSEPWSIRVDLPDGAEVLEMPEGAEISGERVFVQATLDRDLEVLIRYALSEGD